MFGVRRRRIIRAGFDAYARGDLDEAKERFARVLQRHRVSDPASAETAECHNALARIHHDYGEFAQAARSAQQALEIARQVGTPRGREEAASALNNLGRVDLVYGRYGDALIKFRQAHDLLTDQGRPTLASAVIQQNIGSVYDAMGELTAALTHYQEALATVTALGGRANAWSAA